MLPETNYPKMNVKLIEHKKTKAMAKNAVEVGIGPFIETGHTIFQLKEVWNFSKRKKKCCFEHKNKVCLDHWVPLFLHLILLFYGNISSKLRSFGTQKTVGV